MDAFPSQHFMAVVNAQREMPAGRSSESWTSRCCCSYLEKSDSETAELQQHSSGLHLSSIIELWWILENGLLSAFTSQSSKDSWYVWNFSGYQTFLQCALPQRYWQNCLTKRSLWPAGRLCSRRGQNARGDTGYPFSNCRFGRSEVQGVWATAAVWTTVG